MKSKVIFIIVAIIFILAFIPYDTDDSFRKIQKKYGEDIGAKTFQENCATDSVSLTNVPFGVVVRHCETSWFVLFNAIPFQVKGE